MKVRYDESLGVYVYELDDSTIDFILRPANKSVLKKTPHPNIKMNNFRLRMFQINDAPNVMGINLPVVVALTLDRRKLFGGYEIRMVEYKPVEKEEIDWERYKFFLNNYIKSQALLDINDIRLAPHNYRKEI